MICMLNCESNYTLCKIARWVKHCTLCKIAHSVKNYTKINFFRVPWGKFYTWLKTFTQPSVVMVVTNVRCANRWCDIFTDEWEETWRGALWQRTSDELCGERRTCSCTETNPINFWFLSLGQLLPSFYVSLALVRVKGRKYVLAWKHLDQQSRISGLVY